MTLKRFAMMLSISLFLVTQNGGACSTTPDQSRPSESDGDSSIDIPRDARRVAEGSGNLSYTARRDGRVYVMDLDDRVVLDNRAMRRNQVILVNPDANRITLDNRKVFDGDLKRKHNHRIYFLEDDRQSDNDRYDEVPQSAERLVVGGGELSASARHNGRLFVYDENDKRVMYSQRVRKNDRITLSPDRNRITIDGTSYEVELSRKHGHRLYLERD